MVGIGGALGACSRYMVSQMLAGRHPGRMPWGTITVNLVGCLLIGMLTAWTFRRAGQATHWSAPLLIAGFLGAFTTFSTFANETRALIADSRWMEAAATVLIQNVGGVLLAFAGYVVVHRT